jgi:hypothetical protein
MDAATATMQSGVLQRPQFRSEWSEPPDKRKRRPEATGAASIVFNSTSDANTTEPCRASQARYLGRKYGLRVSVARVVVDALLVRAAR